MNILQCLLILISLASLFVTGPNLVPVQSYTAVATDDNDNNKITKDYKSGIHRDIDSQSEKTNQHLGQDNLCYRSPECKQTNDGEQITGKDNTASGFNDQGKNIQQLSSASTPTTQGTPGNGTTPTPTTSTLTVNKHVECNFTSTTAECPTADEFNITATTDNGSSISFNGSETGTPLRINPPFLVTYQVTESNALPGFVIDNIPVGSAPQGIAFNPNNGFLYVTNFDSGTVSVIDPSTNTVVATIPLPVGGGPGGIAFNPDNGFMYVANRGSTTVSVINPATNTVVATIPVGSGPSGIAFNPNNGFLYVTNTGSTTVSVINPATNTVVATIPVGAQPLGIAFNPNNGFLYVTSQTSSTVSVIDSSTNTVVATIPFPVGVSPATIAFNPNNGFLYVTSQTSSTVSVIDPSTNTVVATIPMGTSSFAIAFNPDNGFMYVTSRTSSTVSVIDPLTTTFSSGCNGTISNGGQTTECTITNAYGRPA
jgi:YVTN family beta-propeller protein